MGKLCKPSPFQLGWIIQVSALSIATLKTLAVLVMMPLQMKKP